MLCYTIIVSNIIYHIRNGPEEFENGEISARVEETVTNQDDILDSTIT